MEKSARRERFEKVASNRVNIILKYLDSLGKCSNKSNYEYSASDVKKMLKAIKDKVGVLEREFNGGLDSSDKSQFHF